MYLFNVLFICRKKETLVIWCPSDSIHFSNLLVKLILTFLNNCQGMRLISTMIVRFKSSREQDFPCKLIISDTPTRKIHKAIYQGTWVARVTYITTNKNQIARKILSEEVHCVIQEVWQFSTSIKPTSLVTVFFKEMRSDNLFIPNKHATLLRL